jgi:hypothetical protein
MSKKKKAETESEASSDYPTGDLGLVHGGAVKEERVQWDWPGMVVRFGLNLIDGHKGTGKSSIMSSIAAALCSGRKLPEARTVGPKGSCLWFGSEEHFGGSIVTRWVANGGAKNQILTLPPNNNTGFGRLALPGQEDRLREMVRRCNARCIVLDPYTAVGEAALDTRHEQSTRLYLESLARIAAEEHCTIMLGRHLRKGRSGSLLEHGLGSVAIAAVCRSVLRVERDKQEPSMCYLACVAGNHGKASGVIPYRLDEEKGSVFVAKFLPRRDRDLEEVLEGGDEPDERDTLADARRLLTDALKGGGVDAKILIEEAKRNGIGERTLRKAKAEMKVVSKRIAAGKGVAANWQWRLPTA